MIHTKETISKELARIQANVPQMFKDHLFTESLRTPDMLMVAQKALEDPNFPQEKKEMIQKEMELGTFSQKQLDENPKVAKQRDIWMENQIKLAVKEGRLPNKKQLAKIQNDK